jgi:hypothetical protein
MLNRGSANSPSLPISRPFHHIAALEATLKSAQPAIPKASVKWKVLIIRQNIKEGQPNFRVFFKDFVDSQRVTFYAPILFNLEEGGGMTERAENA